MSRRRALWAMISVAVFLLISFAGYMVSVAQSEGEAVQEVDLEMSVARVAKTLGVTPANLTHELGIEQEVEKERKVSEYGVTPELFTQTVQHILAHKPAVFKQFIMIGICVFGAFFLLVWGKSEDGKTLHYNRLVYYLALLVTVFASFWLGKSPSPMEGIVKLFKAHAGLYPDVAAKTIGPTVLVLFFVVLFNKVICGWACPFGALQELLNNLPLVGEEKKVKVPFWLSNAIRGVIFVGFLLVLFGVVGNLQGVTIYHYINPFNLFDFNLSSVGVVIMVILSLGLGLLIYRPFCHFICPMGFVSWIFEQVSIFKVRIDHEKCIECGACVDACPSTACKAILDDKALKPDCFSCMKCLSSCPVSAIKYGLKYKEKMKE